MNAEAPPDSAARRSPAERLRAAVAAYAWDALRPGLSVTISIGVVGCAMHATDAEMLDAADAQLYQAKRAGRNCVR